MFSLEKEKVKIAHTQKNNPATNNDQLYVNSPEKSFAARKQVPVFVNLYKKKILYLILCLCMS